MGNPMHPLDSPYVTGELSAFRRATNEMKTLLSSIAFGNIAESADIIDVDTRVTLKDGTSQREFYEEYIEPSEMTLYSQEDGDRLFVADKTQRHYNGGVDPEDIL